MPGRINVVPKAKTGPMGVLTGIPNKVAYVILNCVFKTAAHILIISRKKY